VNCPPRALLEVKELKTYYPVKEGVFSRVKNHIKAVDGVSFTLFPHETLGLVGESGCGKSTLGRAIMRLEDISDGQIFFEGEEISLYSRRRMRPLWKKMQMVFQDPYSSLNPRKTVENSLEEILLFHRIVPPSQTAQEIDRIMNLLGLSPQLKGRFPHEFSGGQRQRISIARALTLRPKLLICDEAVSALDVSIQAQILALFRELRSRLGLTYLFIAHGLGAVKYMSDKIAVMYMGKIVELAPSQKIFEAPRHPYTQALLSAYPDPDPRRRGQKKIVLSGQAPSPASPSSGCRFHTRCPFAEDICRSEEPPLQNEDGHRTACHRRVHASDWSRPEV
jgi:peptide/nickel transport system ATP-binding protein/oligopeptide transport system ATP-binding protein